MVWRRVGKDVRNEGVFKQTGDECYWEVEKKNGKTEGSSEMEEKSG